MGKYIYGNYILKDLKGFFNDAITLLQKLSDEYFETISQKKKETEKETGV